MWYRSCIVLFCIVVFCFTLLGCSKLEEVEDDHKLVIYSPHPLEFIDPIVGEFESESGIEVEVITAGTGELLARIESEEETPVGDVLWGGSLATLDSKRSLFEPFQSENEDYAIYKNVDGYITRFTAVPSVIMVNTNLIGDIKIEGYKDLLNTKLKGKIANADPSKSSSSYEQLLNQLQAMGGQTSKEGWDYVRELTINLDGILLESSSLVYRGVVEGEFVVGLTFEEAAALYVQDGAPVAIIYPSEGTIIRPDGVAIIKNAKNIEGAQKFINFVTSKEVQRLISTELNRRSIRDDVEPAQSLKSYQEINIIEDDQQWSSLNKAEILSQYQSLFLEIYGEY